MRKIIYLSFFLAANFSLAAQNLDINILKDLSEDRNRGWDREIENMSNSIRYLGAALPITMITIGLIKKDTILKINGLEIAAAQIVNGCYI